MSALKERTDLTVDLREAAEELTRAEKAPPLEMQLDASQAEKLVVRMRDELIGFCRKDPESPEVPCWKAQLTQLNGILSMIIGIEYPSSFVRREMITQARDLLRGMLAEGG
jgi:hypothetical protein